MRAALWELAEGLWECVWIPVVAMLVTCVLLVIGGAVASLF